MKNSKKLKNLINSYFFRNYKKMEKNDKIIEKKNFFDCLPDYIIENCIFFIFNFKRAFFCCPIRIIRVE